MMLIESTFGNDLKNMRDHFIFIKERYGKVKGLGIDRFETFYHAFNLIRH